MERSHPTTWLAPLLRAPLLLAWLLLPGTAAALDITGNYHPLSTEFEYLKDTEGTLTLEHLLANPAAHPFTPSRESTPRGGFTPVWLKLQLNFSETVQDRRYFLFTRIENLYDIRIHRPEAEGGYRELVTGNNYPASTREVDAPRYGFIIDPSAEPQTIYIRYIGGPGANQLPWDLVEEETYVRQSDIYYSFDVAAFSAISALLLFNLFIALSLRKAEYLFYSCYVLSVTLGLATLDGIGFYYLWPDAPALNQSALHSFNLISSATRLLTILAFLGVATFAPRLHRIALWVLGLLAVAFMVVNFAGVTALPPYALTIPWAIGILLGFVICAYAIYKRVRLAIPLLITLLIPSVAAVLQGFLTVSSGDIGVVELQIAKIGFVLHVLMFSLCLAAQIKLETESRILALHDNLTGLPGVTLLQERFELAANLCRRQGMKTAVFFIDLDGFKEVNDTLGHAGGDQLLMQVAGRMQLELRRTDTVSRIGGDEFVVLLTQVTEDGDVSQLAEEMLSSVARPYLIGGRESRISASIGIAMFPDEGEDLQSLLAAADRAMYDSKRRGKNRYTLSQGRVINHPSQFGQITRIGTNQPG